MRPFRESFDKLVGKGEQHWCHQLIHPNPKFYKHRFQIYTPDLPWEGSDFFLNAPRLGFAEFWTILDQYRTDERSCLIYVYKQPRKGNTPFDPSSKKWSQVQFAPAWEDDADPVEDGHK